MPQRAVVRPPSAYDQRRVDRPDPVPVGFRRLPLQVTHRGVLDQPAVEVGDVVEVLLGRRPGPAHQRVPVGPAPGGGEQPVEVRLVQRGEVEPTPDVDQGVLRTDRGRERGTGVVPGRLAGQRGAGDTPLIRLRPSSRTVRRACSYSARPTPWRRCSGRTSMSTEAFSVFSSWGSSMLMYPTGRPSRWASTNRFASPGIGCRSWPRNRWRQSGGKSGRSAAMTADLTSYACSTARSSATSRGDDDAYGGGGDVHVPRVPGPRRERERITAGNVGREDARTTPPALGRKSLKSLRRRVLPHGAFCVARLSPSSPWRCLLLTGGKTAVTHRFRHIQRSTYLPDPIG